MAKKSPQNSNNAKIRDLANNPIGPRLYGVINRYSEFLNLVSNAIDIEGLHDYRQLKRVKRLLLENGKAGYDDLTKRWYEISECGALDVNGDYTSAKFIAGNARTFTRDLSYEPKEGGAFLIDALPQDGITFGVLIKEACDFMEQADTGARQNMDGCKTPFVAVCKDESTRLSLELALEQKQMGQAAIIVSPELGDALKGINFQTNFIAPDMLALRNDERDTLLNKLGVLTANVDKKERIQSAEVNAKLGECTDYIYMMIDTFNKQCDLYGLPFHMIYNGAMEELYEDGDPEAVSDQDKDQEQGAIE